MNNVTNNDLLLSMERLNLTLNNYEIAYFNRLAIKTAEFDRKFQKLLEWARKMSEKTGIPLENL